MEDIDGDGLDDIFAKSASNDEGGTDAGKTYIIYGKRSLDMRPMVEIDNEYMVSKLQNGKISGEYEIKWFAADREDGSDLNISIFYNQWGGPWNLIEYDVGNDGSYLWDTGDPRIPDGEIPDDPLSPPIAGRIVLLDAKRTGEVFPEKETNTGSSPLF